MSEKRYIACLRNARCVILLASRGAGPNGKGGGRVAKLSAARWLAILALIVIGFASLYFAYVASYIGPLNQIGIGILSLIAVGVMITKVGALNGSYGLYMIGGKRGIGIIQKLSRHGTGFWNAMAMWGIVLGFGLVSYPLLRGRIDKRLYAFGVVSIVLLIVFALPFMSYALQFITLPQLQSLIGPTQGLVSPLELLSGIIPNLSSSPLAMALDAFSAVFGFSGFIMLLLYLNAAKIIGGLVVYAQSVLAGAPQLGAVTAQVPGVAPIIPGIDLPLVAGVLSLAIILIVHEFSHGVLSRIFKVRIRTVGLLMLGVIPVGAFVDPDERQVKKLDRIKQSKIFGAGVSANFVTSVLFFFLMLAVVVYAIPGTYMTQVRVTATNAGFPAYGVVPVGSTITMWNGVPINNYTTLTTVAGNDTPGKHVTIVAQGHTYSFTAKGANTTCQIGIIGVDVSYNNATDTLSVVKTIPGFPAYGVIPNGTIIRSWNGVRVRNLAQLANASFNDTPGSSVSVGTPNNTYTFTAKAASPDCRGYIGVDVYPYEVPRPPLYDQAVYFIFTLLALLFMLSFFIAIANFLPVPGFDGWHMYRTNIKSKKVMRALSILVVVALLLNVIPLFAYYLL